MASETLEDATNVRTEKVRTSGELPNETNENPKRAKLQLPLEPSVLSAWDYWRNLGQPKLMVAPMVDQSELPFRMLCRRYGATAAYTPMLHSRLFSEDAKYRNNEFSTCPGDRPLLVQFCANNPDTLLSAAKLVEPFCDYVDLNLGCPQRIAKRGRYGAFLMDDLPLIHSLVSKLASNLQVPVSCKIRIFPCLDDTIAYAKMLQSAGCSLLAVHGRTREQKCSRAVKADWEVIKAVRNAVRIPVLANGNVRWLEDAERCIEETGVEGVLSAESLLENPALFGGYRLIQPSLDQTSSKAERLSEAINEAVSAREEDNKSTIAEVIDSASNQEDKIQASVGNAETGSENGLKMNPVVLLLEYLDLCEKYPVPQRMIRAHVHKLLGNWFKVHPDLRQKLNNENKISLEFLRSLAEEMRDRISSSN